MTDKEFKTYLALCGKNIKRELNLLPFFKVMSFILTLIIFFGSAGLIVLIAQKAGKPWLSVFIMLSPPAAGLIFTYLLSITGKRAYRLKTLQI